MIKTRFAPSPTGELHIGNLRSALYEYLFAKHNGGVFLMRLEVTDQSRKVEGSDVRILEILEKVGIKTDEGLVLEKNKVIEKGDLGPYIQSKRLDLYKKHTDELLEKDVAYRCFCDPEKLSKMREQQKQNKEPIGYQGDCRTLSKEEIQTHLDNKTPFVIRMAMPESGKIDYKDLVRGKIEFDFKNVDDFVLVKSDGFPTYHLANVVDDHLMEITHVIRGEEWISSVPKHLTLYKAFEWEAPEFAHIPLLLNSDKSKLSKRQGDVSVEDFFAKGYLPKALINFIALLGFNPKADQEIYTLEELVKFFDIKKVNKSGAIFNLEKLNWLNRHYMQELNDQDFLDLVKPYIKEKGFTIDDEKLSRLIKFEKERISFFAEIGDGSEYLFNGVELNPETLVWKNSTKEKAQEVLQKLAEFLAEQKNWDSRNLEKEIKNWIQESGYNNGEVLWPMRVALSGKKKSPDPFNLAYFYGKEQTLNHIKQAYEAL